MIREEILVHYRLPSQAGVQFVNRQPNSIESATTPKMFKILNATLVTEQFYSADEFMEHDWENAYQKN